MDHKVIREAVEAYRHMLSNMHSAGYAYEVAFRDIDTPASIEHLLSHLDAETTARREAQEQLYAERERHTAEVKKLQSEIGRLQALRPVAMTPSEVTEAFDSELRSSYTDFEAGIRTAEIHHGITKKEPRTGRKD